MDFSYACDANTIVIFAKQKMARLCSTSIFNFASLPTKQNQATLPEWKRRLILRPCHIKCRGRRTCRCETAPGNSNSFEIRSNPGLTKIGGVQSGRHA